MSAWNSDNSASNTKQLQPRASRRKFLNSVTFDEFPLYQLIIRNVEHRLRKRLMLIVSFRHLQSESRERSRQEGCGSTGQHWNVLMRVPGRSEHKMRSVTLARTPLKGLSPPFIYIHTGPRSKENCNHVIFSSCPWRFVVASSKTVSNTPRPSQTQSRLTFARIQSNQQPSPHSLPT